MSIQKHSRCGEFFPAKIQGRSLQVALDLIKPNHQFPKFQPSDWVAVCPRCDAYALGAEMKNQWPFLCADGAWRVVGDFDGAVSQTLDAEIFEFGGLKFSAHALTGAIYQHLQKYTTTPTVEEQGAQLNAGSDFLDFSQSVCTWGGGQRVYANLIRFNGKAELRTSLQAWLLEAKHSDNLEQTLAQGVRIKGLGISFASKHLRMLDPHKYAVLDSVLSEGLGFALNLKGYALFMNMLTALRARHQFTQSLAQLEAGIFYLVRQQVRANDASA